RARGAVHSRRKRSPHVYRCGSGASRTRMAVSSPRSERRSMAGARGDAHAKEWPGAMIPAFPAVASRPKPSFSSSTVTSWPPRARKYAVGRIEQELAEAREIGGAGNLGQDGRAPLYSRLASDASCEVETEQPPAD